MVSPSPAPPVHRRVRSFLLYAFAISIALHMIIGPLIARWRQPEQVKEQVEKVSVTRRVVVNVPTPSPPPSPTPSPPPTPTPKPTKPPPPKPAARLKIAPPKTKTQTVNAPVEPAAPPATSGSENGAPNGTSAGTSGGSGNGNGNGTASAAPVVAATRPPCANPNVPPKTLNAVAPDTPDIARQQGITGVVEVKVDLNEKSQITGVSIYRSPNPVLNKPAMDAAKASKFQTEVQNCLPLASSYLYRVEFQSE
jgi:TonB family protein